MLIRDACAGLLRVPPFQRPFVWADTDVLALLNSLVDGIWPGVIVLWDRHDMPGTGHQIAGVDLPGSVGSGAWIVDGQQRVGSLLRAFTVPNAFSWDIETMRPIIGDAGRIPFTAFAGQPQLFEWCRGAEDGIVEDLACVAYDRIQDVDFTVLILPMSWTVTEVMDQFRRMNSTGVRFTADELEDALRRAGGET